VSSLEALASVLPVLLLVGLGVVLRRRRFLQPSSVDDLRSIVLDLTLPAALFLTFLRVSLEPVYGLIVVIVFGACLVMLSLGPFVGRAVGVRSPAFPPMLAGFEAGMIGYAIFGAAFGQDDLYRFAIVDLGQVTFVFFVLVPLILRRYGGHAPSLLESASGFVRTPVIIAIVAGIAGSALGLANVLDSAPLGNAILTTLGLLAAMTTPLIAIVIGYSTTLRRGSLQFPLRTVAVRMAIWVALALVFNAVVIDRMLNLDRLFQAAVLTMAVLPPPFVIPLYMRRSGGDGDVIESDHAYVVNTLSLATVATLVAFAVIGVVYAG
jgi:predicted permease